jgi:uncharacterized membrane protein HdeD (DUF308 family)
METKHIEQVELLTNLKKPEGKVWHWLLGTGIFTIFLGMAAILLPFVATLTVEAVIAAVLVIAGITYILHTFQSRQSKGMVLNLLIGVLYGLVGIMLLVFPLRGALTLTLLLIALFIFAGVFKIALSIHLRPSSSWGWLMFSGIVSIGLAIIIWMGLPGTARWAIGLLVGIELLFSGLTMTKFAMSIKNMEKKYG